MSLASAVTSTQTIFSHYVHQRPKFVTPFNSCFLIPQEVHLCELALPQPCLLSKLQHYKIASNIFFFSFLKFEDRCSRMMSMNPMLVFFFLNPKLHDVSFHKAGGRWSKYSCWCFNDKMLKESDKMRTRVVLVTKVERWSQKQGILCLYSSCLQFKLVQVKEKWILLSGSPMMR